MRKAFVLCIVLLLLPVVMAEVEVVLDKSVSDGATVDLNMSEYTILIGSSNNSLIKLQSDNETILLERGECITKYYDELCYISYENEKVTLHQTNSRPIIDVTRSQTSKKISIGETATITTVFENKGGTDITDFKFVEMIPNELTVETTNGVCKEKNNVITLDKDLDIDDDLTCEYTVIGGQESNLEYVGNITTRFITDKDDIKDIPNVVLETTAPFVYSFNVSTKDIRYGEPVTLSVFFNNSEDGKKAKNLSLSMEINMDDGFTFVSATDTKAYSRGENVFWNAKIEPTDTLEEDFVFTPKKASGNISLDVKVTFVMSKGLVNDEEKTFERLIPMNVAILPLDCYFQFVPEGSDAPINGTIPALSGGYVMLVLDNPNLYADFRYIDPKIEGDISFYEDQSTKSIRRQDSEILLSTYKEFDEQNKSYDLSALINYRTEKGDRFETSCKSKFVVGEEKRLELHKEVIYASELVGGIKRNVTTVKLSVRNDYFSAIKNIELNEILPAYVYTNNPIDTTFSLDPGKEKEFSYNILIADESLLIDEISLPTQLIYDIRNETFIDEKVLLINTTKILTHQEGIDIKSVIDKKVSNKNHTTNQSAVSQNNTVYIQAESDFNTILLWVLGIALLIFVFASFSKEGLLHRFMEKTVYKKEVNDITSKIKRLNNDYKRLKQDADQSQKEILALEHEVASKTLNLKKSERESKYLFNEVDRTIKKIEKQKKKIESKMRSQQQKNKKLEDEIQNNEKQQQVLESHIRSLQQAKQSKKDAIVNQHHEIEEQLKHIRDLEQHEKQVEQGIEKTVVGLEETKREQEYLHSEKKRLIQKEMTDLERSYEYNRKLLKEKEKDL